MEVVDARVVSIFKTASTPRIGVELEKNNGHVVLAAVVPGSPASHALPAMAVDTTEVIAVLAVNGQTVGDDAALAAKLIAAGSVQCTSTGKMQPIRLTIGRLQECDELHSPKGIDELELGDLLIKQPRHVTEVVQSI